jgi:hypothetical protein
MRMRGNATVVAMQLERPTRRVAEVRIFGEIKRECVKKRSEAKDNVKRGEEGVSSSMPRRLSWNSSSEFVATVSKRGDSK